MSARFFDDFEDLWGDFDIRMGPFRWGMHGMGKNVKYNRTEDEHILRVRINPEIKKEEIKAKLIEPGVIELRWPVKRRGEDIPVE